MAWPEVYAWPEGSLWVYTGNGGATGSNPLAYVQDVKAAGHYEWSRVLSPASGLWRNRVTYTLKDQAPSLTFRAYTTAMTLFLLAMSATAVNADFQASALLASTPASAAFRFISGRFDAWEWNGEEGGIFEGQFTMQFAEVSALWT